MVPTLLICVMEKNKQESRTRKTPPSVRIEKHFSSLSGYLNLAGKVNQAIKGGGTFCRTGAGTSLGSVSKSRAQNLLSH